VQVPASDVNVNSASMLTVTYNMPGYFCQTTHTHTAARSNQRQPFPSLSVTRAATSFTDLLYVMCAVYVWSSLVDQTL